MLVARAVSDVSVQKYCSEAVGENVDVGTVINGSDEFVLRVFYSIFEPRVSIIRKEGFGPRTHEWMLKRLVDGLGMSFPREIIHLGNMAVQKQRDRNREDPSQNGNRLIGSKALRQAFDAVSAYRCDTYLNAEFPHLARHFDVFRGKKSPTFTREDLHALFEGLEPAGDDAIRAVYDVGLVSPTGKNIDSANRFEIPLLYRSGLGVVEKRSRRKKRSAKPMVEKESIPLETPPAEVAQKEKEQNIPLSF